MIIRYGQNQARIPDLDLNVVLGHRRNRKAETIALLTMMYQLGATETLKAIKSSAGAKLEAAYMSDGRQTE